MNKELKAKRKYWKAKMSKVVGNDLDKLTKDYAKLHKRLRRAHIAIVALSLALVASVVFGVVAVM